MYTLERTQTVAKPLSEVFAFFADAANLEKLTPPFLHFHILTPLPIEMRAGALIDYQIRLHGIPMRWRTEITSFTPGVQFVDTQLRGPYRTWIHTHQFRATEAGTEIHDHIEYALPLAPLSRIVHPLVRRQLVQIFDYRARTTAQLLG